VRAGTPGLSIGPHKHKMGQRGSSTSPVIFEDVRVPACTMLGALKAPDAIRGAAAIYPQQATPYSIL